MNVSVFVLKILWCSFRIATTSKSSINEKELQVLFLIRSKMNRVRTLKQTREARALECFTNIFSRGSQLRKFDSLAFWSQLNAYRKRKNVLFERMKFATVLLCFVVIFLVWLQDWLPKKNRQFWNRGMSTLTQRELIEYVFSHKNKLYVLIKRPPMQNGI